MVETEKISSLTKEFGGTDQNIAKKLNIHPHPLTFVGEKTPWMKVNKYPHPLKNLVEQITSKKANIHPHPLACVGEKTPWK